MIFTWHNLELLLADFQVNLSWKYPQIVLGNDVCVVLICAWWLSDDILMNDIYLMHYLKYCNVSYSKDIHSFFPTILLHNLYDIHGHNVMLALLIYHYNPFQYDK